MAKKPPVPLNRPSKPVKDFTEKELIALIHNSFERFAGSLDRWESAVGMMMLGKYMGWKVVQLVHSRATVKQYEETLGINIRYDFDPTTEISTRSYAWRAVEGVSNFWKAVKGETDIQDAHSPRIDAAG